MRRLVAFIALLAVFGSFMESWVGVLRDGEVHHETASAAAAHALRQGDHGHEDGGSSPSHQHGPEHKHGTGADHCTHTHSPALPASFAFALHAGRFSESAPEPAVSVIQLHRALFHPPRA